MPVQPVARTMTVAAAGAYLVVILPGVRHGTGPSTFRDVGLYPAVLLLAAAACGARSLRVPRDRLAWGLFAVGLASYATGALVFNAVLLPSGNPPYPSVADALWLAFYPAAIVAMARMVRARSAGYTGGLWLDGVVSGLGLASLSAALVFPKVTQGGGGSTAEIVTNFAYPVLDLALLITSVGAITALGAWRDRSWRLLSGGFLVFSFADSWYLLQVADGSYRVGSLVDFSYLAAAAMIALASKDRGEEPAVADRVEAHSRSFLIPGAFALVAIGVLAGNVKSPSMAAAIILAVGALTAAWVRTALTVRQVVLLSDSRRQARTDALTGLPNRRAFYEVLEAAALDADAAQDRAGGKNRADGKNCTDGKNRADGKERADEKDRAQEPLGSVVLADLDRFKEVNDAIGHRLGDELLRQVSQRLAALVPAGGTIARLGGDEVALFVPGMATTEAAELSRCLLAALQEPFWIQDLSLHVTASIGITAVEPGTQVSQVLAKADLAMYRAKEEHSGCQIYDDERDGDAWNRLALGEDLREALTAGTGLTVEFQPICGLPELTPVGLEALVRWNHPVRGRIAPDAFLSLAETAGLMSAITRTVLDLSLDEATRLRERGWTIPVSVNLSASDLLDDNLVEHVEQALGERGLAGDALRIEITESLLVDTTAGALDRLLRLRALGVDLAVDDYGTGYSCLAYLHDLPVSYLKVDRSFVDRVLRDERTALIVASTVEMAHGLGLKVVAEGLETTDQQAWLAAHGCDLVQGFLLSRPVPPERLYPWLAERARPGGRRPRRSGRTR